MRKKIVLFSIIIFIGAYSLAQTSSADVYQFAYRFGKPYGKGILVKKILFSENGSVLKEIEFLRNGNTKKYTIFDYNDSGKIIKQNVYNSEGIMYESTEFFYAENGNETFTKTFNRGGILIDKTEYKYSDKKDWSERIKYNTQGIYSRTLVEKFTSDGKRLSGKVYGKNNAFEYNFEIASHDKFGNETEKRFLKPDGTIHSFYKEEYNEANKLIWKIYSDKYKINYIYDQNGKLFQEIHFDINTDEPQFLYQYKYL